MRKNTESTGNTKEDSVVRFLSESVVLKKDTRVRVHIGPGVLGLTVLGEDLRSNLVDGGNKVEEIVIGHVLKSELTLGGVTGIGLSKNSMTVTRNDTAGIESIPEVLLNILLGDVATNLTLHLENPLKNFLVSTSMKRTGKTVKTGGKRKERRRKGRTDQVSSVGGNVTTFVISVNGKVKSQKLNKLLVLAKSKQTGKVLGVVGRSVSRTELTIFENITVDTGSNGRKLSKKINRIFIGVLPVLLLVDTSLVGLGKGRLRLKSVNSNGELSHRVKRRRGAVNELLNVLGKFRSGSKFSRKCLNLSLGGDLTGQQKPEKTFRKGFITTGALGELFLKIRNGLTTETNTLFRIKDGTFPNKSLDTTLTTVNLVKEDLTDNSVTVLLSEFLDLLNLLGEKFSETLLKSLVI